MLLVRGRDSHNCCYALAPCSSAAPASARFIFFPDPAAGRTITRTLLALRVKLVAKGSEDNGLVHLVGIERRIIRGKEPIELFAQFIFAQRKL
jgi:hypothetical protein